MNKVPLTKSGFERLKDELQNCKNKIRQKIIAAISTAREHGDLKENAEYHAACEQQAFNEGRIKELEAMLNSAQIIDPSKLGNNDRVIFSATVDLRKDSDGSQIRYQIVGDAEADIDEGRLSISSPLARCLIGKSVGDNVSLEMGDSAEIYEILTLEYI